MPRIVGVDIPERKKLKIALTYIYGVGPHLALSICQRCNLDPETRVYDLTDAHAGVINALVQNDDDFMVEGDLRRKVQQDIRRLQHIKSYRGFRHRAKLPVRGQRTKTNARTRKGGKRTVGAIRDKAERKAAR